MLAQGIGFTATGGTIAVGQCGRFDRTLDTRLVQQLAVGTVPLGLSRRACRTRLHRVEAFGGAAHVVQIAIGG